MAPARHNALSHIINQQNIDVSHAWSDVNTALKQISALDVEFVTFWTWKLIDVLHVNKGVCYALIMMYVLSVKLMFYKMENASVRMVIIFKTMIFSVLHALKNVKHALVYSFVIPVWIQMPSHLFVIVNSVI